jgi:hypothetical protein
MVFTPGVWVGVGSHVNVLVWASVTIDVGVTLTGAGLVDPLLVHPLISKNPDINSAQIPVICQFFIFTISTYGYSKVKLDTYR